MATLPKCHQLTALGFCLYVAPLLFDLFSYSDGNTSVSSDGDGSVSNDDCTVQKEGTKLESVAHCMVCILK